MLKEQVGEKCSWCAEDNHYSFIYDIDEKYHFLLLCQGEMEDASLSSPHKDSALFSLFRWV